MREKKITVKLVGDDCHTAYIYLPGRPKEPTPGIVKHMVSLDDIIENFKGPRVHLNFDENSVLIGIEVLA